MTTESLSQPSLSSQRPAPSPLNVPNILCAMRLAGAPILVALAIAGQIETFIALLIFLMLTDWLDGKLAVLWKQQTTLGARLDSLGDAAMYGALLFGAYWFRWDTIVGESAWLIAALFTYALSIIVALAKFRRLPSYHTRAAKSCWLLTSIAAVGLFAGWATWPLRVAAVGVALTNLEAVAITAVLPCWQADVTSIYHAWRDTETTTSQHATG